MTPTCARRTPTFALSLALAFPLAALAACSSPAEDGAAELAPICEPPLPEVTYDLTPDSTFPVGPVVQNVTPSSASIMWEPGSDCEGFVDLGEAPDALQRHEVSSVTDGIHKVHLTDLLPATRYYYRVSACEDTTRVLSFRTAPPDGTSVRFAVWGDSRSDPATCSDVVQAMALDKLVFTINTGDIVADGKQWDQYRTQYFDPLRVLGQHVPTFVAIGNHEDEGAGFYAYLDQPYPQVENPREMGGTFTFTFGNVFVLVVDTSLPALMLTGADIEGDASRWVEQAVASPEAKRATWRVAVGHHPAWSESWSPGSCDQYDGSDWVDNWLMPLLVDNGFHVYFAGHTHTYERAHDQSLLHIISGGGGAGLDEWCRDLPETDVYAIAHHFVRVEAGCDEMVLTAVSVPDGTTLDTATVPAR